MGNYYLHSLKLRTFPARSVVTSPLFLPFGAVLVLLPTAGVIFE
jgi:hypothetical protein